MDGRTISKAEGANWELVADKAIDLRRHHACRNVQRVRQGVHASEVQHHRVGLLVVIWVGRHSVAVG
eukprot:5711-Pyramimonas_sp.AAC.1